MIWYDIRLVNHHESDMFLCLPLWCEYCWRCRWCLDNLEKNPAFWRKAKMRVLIDGNVTGRANMEGSWSFDLWLWYLLSSYSECLPIGAYRYIALIYQSWPVDNGMLWKQRIGKRKEDITSRVTLSKTKGQRHQIPMDKSWYPISSCLSYDFPAHAMPSIHCLERLGRTA